MSPQHLATLIIDLSSSTWVTPPVDTVPLRWFSALGSNNPRLNLLDGSYGTQLSAAINALSAQGVSLFLNLTAF